MVEVIARVCCHSLFFLISHIAYRKAIFCRIRSWKKQFFVGSDLEKSNFLSDRVLEFRQKIAGQKKVPTKKRVS